MRTFFLVCRQLLSFCVLCGRERTRPRVLCFLLLRVVISSWGYTLMISSRPNYHPKAPPPSKRICLQYRRPGFNPWVGKIPWRREWKPTPLLPGEFLGQTVGSQRVGHHWATLPFSLYESGGAQTWSPWHSTVARPPIPTNTSLLCLCGPAIFWIFYVNENRQYVTFCFGFFLLV